MAWQSALARPTGSGSGFVFVQRAGGWSTAARQSFATRRSARARRPDGGAGRCRWSGSCRRRGWNATRDAISFFAGIGVCDRGGESQQAPQLLGGIVEGAMEPDVVRYAVGVDACASGGSWQRAVSLLSSASFGGRAWKRTPSYLHSVTGACEKWQFLDELCMALGIWDALAARP